jgi:ATP-binding cassette subfamily C protein
MASAVEDYDRERIEQCVRIAQLQPLVDELPDGLDTLIGGTGIRLSGGEGQRVAVARALYRNPQVLFMDEATSAIDGPTEAALIDAVRSDNPDRTLVMIAHRVNTLLDCDRIIVLRDGRIEEIGTYEELLASSELFATMARHTADPADEGVTKSGALVP